MTVCGRWLGRRILIVPGRGTSWPLLWPRPFRRQRGRFANDRFANDRFANDRFANDAVRLVARTVVAVTVLL